MAEFNLIPPSSILAPYIKCYWSVDSYDPTLTQRIPPVGLMQLVFHYGDRIVAGEEEHLLPYSYLAGQSVDYLDIKSGGHLKMLIVYFQPFGVKAFFSNPMSEFYNTNVSLQDVADKPLLELEKMLYDESDIRACIALIEKHFINRLRFYDHYNFRRVTSVVKQINSELQVDTSALADTACLSKKQFHRVFNEWVGASPKDFSRIVRFQRVLYTLQMNREMNLTELAVVCGFYDQSHMIKEFKQFTGYTPSEFFLYCDPYSDYFSSI